MIANRFSFPGDDAGDKALLDRMSSLEINVYRSPDGPTFTFKLHGSCGDLFGDDAEAATPADLDFLRKLVQRFAEPVKE